MARDEPQSGRSHVIRWLNGLGSPRKASHLDYSGHLIRDRYIDPMDSLGELHGQFIIR
jgi:hypothetical protein